MRLLRLVTGLVIASFVVGHFFNHSLGVVSIEAMDRLRIVLAAWWRSPVGSLLLYGSLLEAEPFLKNDKRIPIWQNFYNDALRAYRAQFKEEDYSGSPPAAVAV